MPHIEVYLNYSPQIANDAFVHSSAHVIGDVTIGKESSVWPGAILRGDVNFIRIGQRSNIQDLAMLHVTHRRPDDPEGAPVIIGDDVTIGHSVVLHGCEIQDRCLIGIGSIVLDRVIIEPEVMLAAGSLVSPGKRLLSGHLYMGRPAKIVRALTPDEIAHFRYSSAHYIKLMKEYQTGISHPLPIVNSVNDDHISD